MTASTITRAFVAAAGLAFVALLGWAMSTLDTSEFMVLMGEPWVQVVLADFYLGILCFAAVVWALEGVVPALAWGIATACLGNPVAALWLVVRGLPRLRAQRAPADA
jgi:hypothetical protein